MTQEFFAGLFIGHCAIMGLIGVILLLRNKN
jgi:hypothetical protein